MTMPLPSAADDILLYDQPGSPCSRRVKITLVEKGLTWRTQLIDLSRLEQRSPRFLAVNPNGLVPALAHGNRVLWESNVITEYLDRVFPERPLYPLAASERLAVKRWQGAELTMAKVFRPLMYQRLMGPLVQASRTHAEAMAVARRSTDDPADLAWEDRVWRVAVLDANEREAAQSELLAFADTVEHALESGPWLVGGRFSQAEISIYPRLSMYELIGVDLPASRFPRTRDWLARMADRPSFLETRSQDERRMRSLVTTPAFGFIRRVTAIAPGKRRLTDRAGLWALGQVLRRLAPKARQDESWLVPVDAPPADRTPAPRATPSLAPAAAALSGRDGDWALEALRAAFAWRRLAVPPVTPGPPGLTFDGVLHTDLAAALDVIDLMAAPGPRLFPEDPWADAQVRLWVAFEASLHKEVRALEAAARGGPAPPALLAPELATSTLAARLRQLEVRLDGRDTLLEGGASFADVIIGLRARSLARLGLPVRTLAPRVLRLLEPDPALLAVHSAD